MSVVVLAEGLPSFETMEPALVAARSLETAIVVFAATDALDAAGDANATAATKLGLRKDDRLVTVPGLAPFSADAWLSTFARLLAATAGPRAGAAQANAEPLDPQLVIIADSAHTRAFFPALALRLKTPLLSAVTRVRVRPRAHTRSPGVAPRLEVERPLHGGLQTERLVVGTPLFVSVVASSAPAAASSSSSSSPSAPSVRHATGSASSTPPRDTVLRVVPPSADTVDIRSADRIVAGGLGLGSQEAVVRMLPRLAKLLHAAVGGTRVISDRGWLEHERYIGSTGKTVAPKLYLALGISGASQHLVGITESETIVAVNTDRAAPIFGVADLGVVGDVHAIIPELEARLTKEAGGRPPARERHP